MRNSTLPQHIESLGREILSAAFEVHTFLGPGLLESTYEHALKTELESRGLEVTQQLAFPIHYKHHFLPQNLIIDLIVESEIILELKAVGELRNLHRSQLLTYLKLSSKKLGYLINFNVPQLKDGIQRMVL